VVVSVLGEHAFRSGLLAFLVPFFLPAQRPFLRPAFGSGSLGCDVLASSVQRLAPLPALVAPAATCSNTFICSRLRVPPSPFRSSLDQLNQERRIGRTKILLRVGHVPSGTTELAQLVVRHFAQAFADSFYVFRVGFESFVLRGGQRGRKIALFDEFSLRFVAGLGGRQR